MSAKVRSTITRLRLKELAKVEKSPSTRHSNNFIWGLAFQQTGDFVRNHSEMLKH